MPEWILILTITSGAPAIDHIEGFASKEQCESAGRAWADLPMKLGSKAVYICVERGSKR